MDRLALPKAVTIDVTVPNMARMYDYLLEGKDNYPADRDAVEHLVREAPGIKVFAHHSHAFTRRVVDVLSREYGVRQFIDFGAGLPTTDNVHEVALRTHPDARVVYVENDPIALAHARALLEHPPSTAVLQADIRHVDAVFDSDEVSRLIDPSEPVGALFMSVLHCIPDRDDPASLLRRVRARLPHGSFLAVSQLVSDGKRSRQSVTDFMSQATAGRWGRVRSCDDVRRYLTELEILPPGLVDISAWRPDGRRPFEQTVECREFGGVARLA